LTDALSHTLSRVLERIMAGDRRDDPDLVRRLDEAFGKHAAFLHRFCRRELRGFAEQHVEEVVQDVLEIAWRRLPEYRVEGRFRTYLWGIASRRCAGVRRRRRDVLTEDGFLAEAQHEADRSVLARLAAEERDALLDEAASNVLDHEQQELVHLRWVLDYPQEEVARLLAYSDKDVVRKKMVTVRRRLEKEVARLLAERDLGASFLRGIDP
jgi:RNA polymerase sigma factor (sigma-70 family)